MCRHPPPSIYIIMQSTPVCQNLNNYNCRRIRIFFLEYSAIIPYICAGFCWTQSASLSMTPFFCWCCWLMFRMVPRLCKSLESLVRNQTVMTYVVWVTLAVCWASEHQASCCGRDIGVRWLAATDLQGCTSTWGYWAGGTGLLPLKGAEIHVIRTIVAAKKAEDLEHPSLISFQQSLNGQTLDAWAPSLSLFWLLRVQRQTRLVS